MPKDAWGCLRLSLNRFRPYLGSPKLYIIIVILESSSRQRGLNFGPVPLRRLGALRSWTYGQNAADTHFVSATGMHLKTLHAPTFSLSQNVVAHPGFSTSRHQGEGGGLGLPAKIKMTIFLVRISVLWGTGAPPPAKIKMTMIFVCMCILLYIYIRILRMNLI